MKARPLHLALICGALVFGSLPTAAEDASHAYMDVHKKMMEEMAGMKMSGNADMDFAMLMIAHHQGAVDMAEVELKYGKDETMRKMAQEIITAQKKEIEEFKAWQKQHGM